MSIPATATAMSTHVTIKKCFERGRPEGRGAGAAGGTSKSFSPTLVSTDVGSARVVTCGSGLSIDASLPGFSSDVFVLSGNFSVVSSIDTLSLSSIGDASTGNELLSVNVSDINYLRYVQK